MRMGLGRREHRAFGERERGREHGERGMQLALQGNDGGFKALERDIHSM